MDRLGAVMYTVLEEMRRVAVHLWPVMPQVAEAMLGQLGLDFDPAMTDLRDEIRRWGALKPGTTVAASSNLFPRVELPRPDQAGAPAPKAPKPAKAKAGAPAPAAPAPAAPEGAPEAIEFADFQRLDLKVGTVASAEPVPKADKLLLLQVDLGEERPRQIVSGIADFYAPADLVGRQVVVLANLKPRTLRGVESQGMILAVKREGGLELLTPSGPVDPGSKVS
jgi:methionyl-tRNA synthetase